jgi:hypothetical protein
MPNRYLPGLSVALCVPVEVLGGPMGTLDLFTAIPRAWDDSEVAAAHAYGGAVASLLGSAVAAHASSRLAKQLQVALDSRVLIEQAKGVLMALRESRRPQRLTGCAARPGTPGGRCPRWPGRSSTACGAPRIIADQQARPRQRGRPEALTPPDP